MEAALKKRFSEDYLDLLAQGPFPGSIDPWGEAERYFPQMAGGILSALQDAYHGELIAQGYHVSRETSLQAFADSLHTFELATLPEPTSAWDYVTAAVELGTEPGLEAELHDLSSLCIREVESGKLVTTLEIIAPTVKEDQRLSAVYRTHRRQLVAQGVSVVELDLTRSPRRLLPHRLAYSYPYHIAVHLPHQNPRLLLMSYGKALKPFALPLHQAAIRVNVQPAYDYAYRAARIAYQELNVEGYTFDTLPTRTALPEAEILRLEAAVQGWMQHLARLGDAAQGHIRD